jgi:hypothetical protein
MNAEWYYVQAGVQRGPIHGAGLAQLAQSGGLGGADLVWRDGLAQWAPAGALNDLLAMPPVSKAPPPLPTAAASARTVPEALPTAFPVAETTAETPPVVQHQPREFKELYDQLLKFSIPVAVVSVMGEAVPGINVIAYLTALVLFVTLSSMFLYKAWDLIQDSRARTTPGKAVGFRFIPFYALYWEFVAVKGLLEDIAAYARRRRIAIHPMSGTLAVWYCVLSIVSGVLGWVPVLGGLLLIPCIVLFLLLMNSVKSACMTIAAAQGGAAAPAAADGRSAMLAGAGALGVVGVVQMFSEGLELVEKVTKASE